MSSANQIRIGGMNSGLDTESIVEAMTAATKLKITKQERKQITLKWKQEAYQDITGKLTDFQNKYFDYLNSKVNLKSSSAYNNYSAKAMTKANGVYSDGAPAGVTLKAGVNATPASYDVKVLKTAKQATYQGSSMDMNSIDVSKCTDSEETYSFAIAVGDKTTAISFKGGTTDEIREQINSKLTEQFGRSNNTDATGRGLVYMDDSGKIVSSDKSTVNMTEVSEMKESVALDTASFKNGTNKLNVNVGDKAYSVSFKTYTAEYLDSDAGKSDKAQLEQNYIDRMAEKEYDEEKAAGNIDSDDLKNKEHARALTAAKEEYETKLKKEFDEGVKNGSIDKTASFDSWKKKQSSFDETAFETKFEKEYDEKTAYKNLNQGTCDLSTEELVEFSNKDSMKTALGKCGVSIDESGVMTADNGDKISATVDGTSTNTFGLESTKTITGQITTATTLKDLGIEGDAKFNINGVEFTFSSDYSIKRMMTEINANKTAGATMSFSTLTNSFTVASSAHGTSAKLDFDAEEGSNGATLLSKLGLDNGTFTEGTNLELEVNGQIVETSSNSYTVDGMTMSFTSAAEGSEFHADVKKDSTEAINAIKSFVEDYNKLIDDVYGKLGEKPDKEYYALTDDDIDEMDLSEKQQEKWEEKAKLGLLYNDSAISSVMNKLRETLYSTNVKTADGQSFSLFSMGIKTSSDWAKHGKLEIDEKALEEAFDQYSDQIEELFTGSTVDENGKTVYTGLMHKMDSVLTGAVKSTGKDKGTLVQLAGLKTGTSVTNNTIYDQLKKMTSLIDSLKQKYEDQQDRYWKKFSNLESIMGDLNGQTSYIQQLMTF